MPVTFRIALRNLREHRSKSIIVGTLLALGVVILVVGNAFMDTAAEGLRSTFTANYTGDVMVSGKSKDPISLFGVLATGGGFEPTPVIPDFAEVRAAIEATPGLSSVAPQLTSFAQIGLGGEWSANGFAILFGIDPATYFKAFDAIKIVEGRALEPGDIGIMISTEQASRLGKRFRADPELRRDRALKAAVRADDFEENPLLEVHVGDELILQGFSSGGISAARAEVIGIYEPLADSEANSIFVYCDADTVRLLDDLTLGRDEASLPSEAEAALLSDTDDEDLFGGEEETVAASTDSGSIGATAEEAIAQAGLEVERTPTLLDSGAWHFLLARASGEQEAVRAIASLNATFAERGIAAYAQDWKAAAGPFAITIDMIRIVFNAAVIILAVVALIIMMNTLLISVLERTYEIGTMRALGSGRFFVTKMFFAEALTLSTIAGIAGVAIGLSAILILNSLGIPTDNPFFSLLLGGKTLSLSVNPLSIVSSAVLVALVAVFANAYPLAIALRIPPVRAMQSE
jgi:putative ABC transport system permease protein